jgi:hypothetical protein
MYKFSSPILAETSPFPLRKYPAPSHDKWAWGASGVLMKNVIWNKKDKILDFLK